MSAPKKRKITHVDENENDSSTGIVQQGVAREREIMEDPSLPVEVKDLLAKQAQALEQCKCAHGKTKSALNAAMGVIFRHAIVPRDTRKSIAFPLYSWCDLPPQIRDDPDCLVQAMRDKNVCPRQSDIPREMLTRHRSVALEACKAGIYPSFRPTPEEWRHDQFESRYALKHGLIKCMSAAPMLTAQDGLDLLQKKAGS